MKKILCWLGWHEWWSTDKDRRACEICGKKEEYRPNGRTGERSGGWYAV